MATKQAGTKGDRWKLKTPPGSSEFEAFRDEAAGVLVVTVGKTVLHYKLRVIADLHAMLKQRGDWQLDENYYFDDTYSSEKSNLLLADLDHGYEPR